VRWGIAQRTAAGSLLLAVTAAAGFGGLIVAIAALTRTNDATRHAEAEIVAVDALERHLLDLESGQRGYVITRDPAFLEPVARARKAIPGVSRRLLELSADDPAQRARAGAIVRAIGDYERSYSAPLIATARTDPARARAIVADARGNRIADRIRAQFERFARSEDALLQQSRADAGTAARRAYWLAGVSAAVLLLLVVAFAWLLRRLVVRPVRELARGARELGRGNLDARVDVPSEGEVGELGAAFNDMAASLQDALLEVTVEQSRIRSLYRFAARIATETDVEELAHIAVDELCELTGAELAVLYVGEGDELWLAATRGVPEESLRPFDRAERVSLRRPGELQLPLRHGDHLVGVAVLAHADGHALAADSVTAAESLVGSVAVALANDLAYRATRRLADVNQIVLDSTRDGIVMLDSEGRRVLVNSSYERQMAEIGVPATLSIADRTQAFADRTTDPEAFSREIEGLYRDRESEAQLEFTAAGSGRAYQLFSSPAFEAGRFVGRVYVLHEVTREREADRLKTELLATVSHELRTPLAGILGFAELLQQPELGDEARTAYLATIHREAVRLTGLINDFLDLQRIEQGALSLALEPLHVRDVVLRQMEAHDRLYAEHRLELALSDEPAKVLADPARLAQVIANLLSNAIKYSPAGGTIRVEVSMVQAAVRVSVSDEGIGIPADQQPRIFEKFFRVDSSDTREIGGTGLGLALSREIVEAHGGRIGFESAPGDGSTFWFELPALGAAAANGRRRVLVVEQVDGESALVRFLEDDGFTVETVESGAEALRRAAADPPAFVCLDVGLPGPLDGWELLASLKARPETASTPVVVCTGSNGRRRASALGAADVLAKPFSRSELLAAVRRILPAAAGRVLVVDDDHTVRSLVSETLRGAGFQPLEAADGAEALAAVGREAPDAIVLDLVMPNLDGFEVLDRLHADPEGRGIPVVVLTARELSSADRSRLRARAVSLLEKSAYSPDELRRLVRQALGETP
jgi:signal transduction histidine kinase/DNA-binding response OmpR family regulator